MKNGDKCTRTHACRFCLGIHRMTDCDEYKKAKTALNP